MTRKGSVPRCVDVDKDMEGVKLYEVMKSRDGLCKKYKYKLQLDGSVIMFFMLIFITNIRITFIPHNEYDTPGKHYNSLLIS